MNQRETFPGNVVELDQLPPLQYLDVARRFIPPREWAVLNRIPARNVTLLSGEGATGKSIVLLQLSVAHVLARDWLGTMPKPGPVLYLNCEEDDDEMCRRLEAIAAHNGVRRDELKDGLHILSYAGKDATLAIADHNDRVTMTALFEQLRRDALRIKPKLIVLDNAADVFGGNESSRVQTRQFINKLRGMGIESGAAVILSSHPSLTGINSGSGLSGSTAWHNSVRARMYFRKLIEMDINADAPRVLEVKKNNYGPVSESVIVRWRNGVFVPEPTRGSIEKMAADQKVDDLFMTLLRRLADQGRSVSDKPSISYAPTVFAKEPEAEDANVTKPELAKTMTRLFAAKKIRVATIGAPSHGRSRIEEVAS